VNLGYQAEKICEIFGPACDKFGSLIFALHNESTAQMEHGEIETFILRVGTEILQVLTQAHLDVRALREPRRYDLTGPDGDILTHCRENCKRRLGTIFGDVTVSRKGYSAPGVESQFPLDGELNLPKDKYSHGLRHRVAEEAALNSFDEVVADIQKTTGGKVPKRQAEEVAVAVAQDFDAFYLSQQAVDFRSDIEYSSDEYGWQGYCDEKGRPSAGHTQSRRARSAWNGRPSGIQRETQSKTHGDRCDRLRH
jgi:hypothetical protein